MATEEKRVVNRAGWRRRGWNVSFEYTAKDGTKKTGKGKRFLVEGIELDLFPGSVLCGILGKELRTLYGWEKNFGFPLAMWRNRDDARCNRYYSRKQLVYIRTLYEHHGRLRGARRSELHEFIAAVRVQFFTIDIPIIQRGNTNAEPVLVEGREVGRGSGDTV